MARRQTGRGQRRRLQSTSPHKLQAARNSSCRRRTICSNPNDIDASLDIAAIELGKK